MPPLFPANATHAEVRCWSCGHVVTIRPEQLPAGIDRHEFERRAKCSKCGTDWPQVTVYPLPPSVWDRKG